MEKPSAMNITPEETMDQLYPGWWNTSVNSETVCIPACNDIFKRAYLGATDPKAANFDEKAFEAGKRFYTGQEAENYFVRCFKQLNIGGVLISGFHSIEFAKTFKQQNRFKKFGIEQFEIDAVFIHPLLGLFAIEIKAAQDLTENSNIYESEQYKKAEKQLENFEKQIPLIIRKVYNSECSVPLYFAFCFPNAVLPEDQGRNRQYIHIDKSCFDNPHKMKEVFTSQARFAGDVVLLKKFACAIATYRSMEFSSAGRNALAVHKMIDLQCQSPSKGFGLGGKISGCDIFWTNEQLDILECNRSVQLISGPPGTGKTIILLQKALSMALSKAEKKDNMKTLIFCSNPNLRQKFQNYFKSEAVSKLFVDAPYARPVIIHSFFDITPGSDIFVDELPLGIISKWLTIFRLVTRSGLAVITGAGFPHQSEISAQLRNEFKSLNMHHIEMKTVLRSTKEIFNVWEKEIPNMQMKLGHNCSGPTIVKTTAINSQQIHENTSKLIKKWVGQISAAERLEQEIISSQKRSRKTENVEKESKKEVYSYFAVITPDIISKEAIKKYLEQNGIPCGTIIEQLEEDIVTVCVFDDVLSLEWPFVILVSLISFDLGRSYALVAASRCMSQLYIIERDCMDVQAKIERKFYEKSRNSLSVSPTLFKDLVIESLNEVGETLNGEGPVKDIFQHDFVCAHIRLDFISPEILQPFDELKNCTTLFECFEKIPLCDNICKLLMLDDALHVYLQTLTNFDICSVPKPLYIRLLSNCTESERKKKFDIFINMIKKLSSRYEEQRKAAEPFIDKLKPAFQFLVCILSNRPKPEIEKQYKIFVAYIIPWISEELKGQRVIVDPIFVLKYLLIHSPAVRNGLDGEILTLLLSKLAVAGEKKMQTETENSHKRTISFIISKSVEYLLM